MVRRRYKRLIKCFLLVFGFVIYYQNLMIPSLILEDVFASYERSAYWKDKAPSIVSSQKNKIHQEVLKISSMLDNMYVHYPSFISFYTGWLQDLDVFYDVNQWSHEPLIVHVIPFSHNDPGWLQTYEEYFTWRTRNILDVVLHRLKANHDMTFVWSEVCYLKKWFKLISEDDRKDFRRLLTEGRFEILTGGMVMPDEAIVPYYSLLNVLTEGHLWLKNELNYSVDTAWSIDSFGHSSTFAYFLKASGIKRTFIQRTHYALKRYLAFKKQIEFYWTHPWDNNVLFTHMSPFLAYSMLYSCGPNIFVCCQFEFIKDRCWKNGAYANADEITVNNVEHRSLDLLEMLRKKAQYVNHNNVLLLVGDDFSYDSSADWDKQWNNMNKIFDYLNSHSYLNVQVRYSTIGKYLRSAENDMVGEAPKVEGDFFPYSDRSNQYWSGYYSTRPKLKSYIRRSQSYLRTTEILFGLVLSKIFGGGQKTSNTLTISEKSEYLSHLKNMREEFSIYQHHDTITGTSRSEVIKDTSKKLVRFMNSIGNLMSVSMSFLDDSIDFKSPPFRLLMTTSGLFDAKVDQVLQIPLKVILFNSLASNFNEVVKLYVNADAIHIVDQRGQEIPCQINPAFLHNLDVSDSIYEVHLYAAMRPLSSLELWIFSSHNNARSCIRAGIQTSYESKILKSFSMSNDFLEVQFNDGIMKRIFQKRNNKSTDVNIKYMVYSSDSNLNPFLDRSGAYIFLPNGKPHELSISSEHLVLVDGTLKSFVIAKLSPEVLQIIEIINLPGFARDGIRVTNVVDISKRGNFEISMILETPVNNIYFFTDLNGYQVEKRKWRRKFGIQGNFYPMTSTAFIEDSSSRVTLVSGQSHAMTSRNKGEIEVMLDRRLLQDDWRGLREGVTDNTPTTSTFTVLLEEISHHLFDYHNVPKLTVAALHNSMRLDGPLAVLIHHNATLPLSSMVDLDSELPCGIHLVSWSILTANNIRMEVLITLHYFGLVSSKFEGNSDLSCFLKTIRVPASKFSYGYPASELYEMNLTGTQVKHRLILQELEISQMEIKTWLFIFLK